MRLFVKDGRLRFDYEREQTDIFTGGDYGFTYLGKGQREYIPTAYSPEEDWATLSACVAKCRDNNVEIASEAEAFIEEYRIKAERSRAQREEAAARREEKKKKAEAKANWDRLKERGCGKCKYLRYDGDMPWCKATRTPLEEKNVADMKKMNAYDDNGVFHLFKWEPFPCVNCVYRYVEEAI